MKMRLMTFVMAFAIFFTTNLMTTQKAHALAGFAFKSKVVKTIGAIGTGAGVSVFGIGVLLAKFGAATTANLGAALVTLIYGPIIAAFGLIILDDKTVVDLEYQPIDYLNTEDQDRFSIDEIEMYNAELEELNAIRKTIQQETQDYELTTEQTVDLWNEYSQNLHPSTIKVAEVKASDFINELKKAHRL